MFHYLDSSWMDAELGPHREWVADEFRRHVDAICEWADASQNRSWDIGPDGIRLCDGASTRMIPPSATADEGYAAIVAAVAAS